MIVAPFIRIPIMQKYATNIHYIVTDRRGFIIEKRKVKALSSEDNAKMRIIEERAGFKSLIFYQYYGLLNLFKGKIPLGFLGISEEAHNCPTLAF